MKSKFCNQLEAYFDETLSSETAHLFELHLEGCQSCREQISNLRELEGLICDAWADVHPATDLNPKILKAPESFPVRIRHRRNRIAWTSLLGIAGAIMLVFFVTSHPVTEPGPDVSQAKHSNEASSIQRVAFFDAGRDGTMLSPVVSNSEFTIVQAFPSSNSINTNTPNPSEINETN